MGKKAHLVVADESKVAATGRLLLDQHQAPAAGRSPRYPALRRHAGGRGGRSGKLGHRNFGSISEQASSKHIDRTAESTEF
jgi:hypothetical protein